MEEKFCIEEQEKEYVATTIRIKKSLWAVLSEISKKTGCSKSNIINQMIKYAVKINFLESCKIKWPKKDDSH